MKENRYSSMVRLRDALNCVFEQCGLDFPKVEIKMSPKIIEVINWLFQDKAVCEYLDTLTEQSVQAKRKIEDINIKQWNYEQIEKKYMLLKDSIKEKEGREEGQKEKEQQKREEKEREQQRKAAEKEKEQQKKEEDSKESLNIIKQIITLRDNLMIKLDIAKESGEKNIIKVIEGELNHTRRILENADVEVIEQVEEFDDSKHIIAGVRQTDNPDMEGHVAAVLRPGYIYKEEMIRPVELILYTEEEDYVIER